MAGSNFLRVPMLKQRTINGVCKTIGIGLHSGTRVQLTFSPAEDNTGIVFRRIDLSPTVELPVHVSDVVNENRLGIVVTSGNAQVLYCERILSACAILGIDNLYVNMTAEEVPIMDGTDSAFIHLFKMCGIREQSYAKKFIRILKEVEVRIDYGQTEQWARLSPFEGFEIHNEISIENQDVFTRTHFDFRDIITFETNRLYPYKLDSETEFARHKTHDIIADLFLIGQSFLASYSGHRANHKLNHQLLLTMLKSPDTYKIVTLEGDQNPRPYEDIIAGTTGSLERAMTSSKMLPHIPMLHLTRPAEHKRPPDKSKVPDKTEK